MLEVPYSRPYYFAAWRQVQNGGDSSEAWQVFMKHTASDAILRLRRNLTSLSLWPSKRLPCMKRPYAFAMSDSPEEDCSLDM